MSIMLTLNWTCDLCGRHTQRVDQGESWSEYTIEPPAGWKSNFPVPKEYRSKSTEDICDACETCQVAPDWTKYKEAR